MDGIAVRLSVAAALTAMAAAALPSRASASTWAERHLILTSFSRDAGVDVERNEVLVFRFSVKLRRRSVDDRTLRIATVEGVPAKGARRVEGHVVRFDPTRTQRNYDASREPGAQVESDHVRGFAADHDYVVTIPAAPGLRVIHGVRGPIELGFTSTFRTGRRYTDPVPGQPSFIGDHGNGLFAFDPPPSILGLIEEDASVLMEFSEPIEPATLVPGETVLVSTSQGPVAGTIREDPLEPNGRRFLFDPTSGWGLADRGAATIHVRLTTGITDLAGNPLDRPVGVDGM